MAGGADGADRWSAVAHESVMSVFAQAAQQNPDGFCKKAWSGASVFPRARNTHTRSLWGLCCSVSFSPCSLKKCDATSPGAGSLHPHPWPVGVAVPSRHKTDWEDHACELLDPLRSPWTDGKSLGTRAGRAGGVQFGHRQPLQRMTFLTASDQAQNTGEVFEKRTLRSQARSLKLWNVATWVQLCVGQIPSGVNLRRRSTRWPRRDACGKR